jgi:hypothetical protein
VKAVHTTPLDDLRRLRVQRLRTQNMNLTHRRRSDLRRRCHERKGGSDELNREFGPAKSPHRRGFKLVHTSRRHPYCKRLSL